MISELGMSVIPPMVGIPTQKFLTIAGDNTGSHDVLGNYLVPTDFYYHNHSDFDIYSILISISDNSSFNQGDYGGIAGGLINGLKFFVYNASSNSEIALLSGTAFKKNYQWFEITADTGLTTFSGAAQTLRIVFNLVVDYGMPFRLLPGDKFIIRVQDDFTPLTGQTFGIRGIKH